MNRDFLPVVPAQDTQVSGPMTSLPADRFSAVAALRLQLHRYLMGVRKRWWVVVLCMLFIGMPVVIYAILRPPTFQSQAIMWLTSRLSLPGGPGFFSDEASSYMNTQAELLRSPAIQQGAFQKVRSSFPEVARLYTNPQPAVVPFDLSIKSSPKSSVLNLQAVGRFPEATRAFLDAVMGEYLELKKDSHQQTSGGALASITDQIKEVEKQTKEQQARLTAFESSNNLSYLTEHGLSAGSHLSKLTELLSDRQTELRLLESLKPEQLSDLAGTPNLVPESGETTARASTASTQASDTAYYQALQQFQLLKSTRDQFAKVLRPTHSKMVKLNQQIAGFEELLKTIKEEGGQRAMVQMANRKQALHLQIESLEAQYRAWETNAAEASGKLSEHDRMKQELLRSQGLYDRLLGLVQTVDLNRNINQEPLSPLAPASMARPVHSTLMLVSIGMFLALGASCGLLILIESFDDRFISATELSCHIPEEVIGQIPETRLRLATNGSPVLREPQDQHAFSESFRSLRSSLIFMFDEAARPKVILLTSSVPKEGKSTVAAHLAASLAVSGSRVVLVDADLRRSTLHQIFGVAPSPGLREVLTQGLPAARAILPVSVPQALASESSSKSLADAKLFLLPSGEPGPGSAEILLSGQVNELLRELSSQFDYVIIDSPPMLATDDAMGLAFKVDGVFVVVRAAYTYSRMVREALDRLHKRHVKVLGLIYNRAPSSTDYYYRYSRDYHNVA